MDALQSQLEAILDSDRIKMRPIDRVAFASDASVYRLIPRAVVQPDGITEILALLDLCRQQAYHLTFRAAGTSLSGQAVTDDLLIDVSRHWRAISVEEDGAKIRFQPGVVGGHLNRVLEPYGRRIGPDPASIDSAMMGGILANNSGGMSCGVAENSYHTLDSMTFVLTDGTTINSADSDADAQLRQQNPDIYQGLRNLHDRLRSKPELVERVHRKYQMKNTTGYSLNALLDFDSPTDILTHLLIGSEGTLGFIAEAVLRTLPAIAGKSTGLLFFANAQHAAAAILPIRESGARAIELMNRSALRSVEDVPGVPEVLKTLPDQATALLVEYHGSNPDEITAFERVTRTVSESLPLLYPADFTRNPTEQALLWKVRKGLYSSISAMRPPQTSAIIEDVAFELPKLADAISDIEQLCHKHGYGEAKIWGHGTDGNLHFVITQSFINRAAIQQYDRFMREFVEIVVNRYDGALKAEHGTGRNMAPFVQAEWGEDGYQIMADLKHLLDPGNILNPGVVINDNPNAHMHHLKPFPMIEAEVDRCIECGFCETQCPSRELTLTPRQRIVVRREIQRLRDANTDADLLTALQRDFQYNGLDTCAVDGLCATTCPVDINTGLLVKKLRTERLVPRKQRIAQWIGDHFAFVEKMARVSVFFGHLKARFWGHRLMYGFSRLAEIVSGQTLPKWSPAIPRVTPGRLLKPRIPEQADVVYFPTCISRIMGRPPQDANSPALIEVMHTLAERAGIRLYQPAEARGLCCGMPFGSKGYTGVQVIVVQRLIRRLWTWSQQGRLPIVLDASSCAYTLLSCRADLPVEWQHKWDQLTILDSVAFVAEWIVPRLKIQPLEGTMVLHPNCSLRKMGQDNRMLEIARACAKHVVVPKNLGCCGFAGDRGLLFPELTASATRIEAAEVLTAEYDGYFSSNLTCEMGMVTATAKPYRSILYLVEKTSRVSRAQ